MAAVAAPAATETPPWYMSNTINIPVRWQIMWAQFNKEYTKVGTSFRQTKSSKNKSYCKQQNEEEREEVLVDWWRRSGEVDWDVILSPTGRPPGRRCW